MKARAHIGEYAATPISLQFVLNFKCYGKEIKRIMKLLLHSCCAPCSIKCIESLRNEEIIPDIFWYNPNIHPYTEYKKRKETLDAYVKGLGLNLILKDNYGLREFLEKTKDKNRCGECYEMRMSAAAEYAAKNGYDAFTTTLLISPYQKHDLLRTVCEKVAEQNGVEFLYRDFRPLFREGQRTAREAGLYMQNYCGCIFSEEERFLGEKGR